MYRVSPLTYIVQGLLSTGVEGAKITCSPREILTILSPDGMSCKEFLGPYAEATFGNILTPNSTTSCNYCSMTSSTPFLISVHALVSQAWRNFGIIIAFTAINVVGALFFYWLGRVPKGKQV